MSADARASGQFQLSNVLPVVRLGLGAMRITGTGVWGWPSDVNEAHRVLQRAVEWGITFIDTADSYGPFVSEELIAQALHPYRQGVVIATKGGLTRHGPGIWAPVGRPEYLRQCVLMSLRRLKVERLDLWQLHRIDPKVPRDEQFGVMAEMQKEGLIKHLGLSEVSVAEIEAARRVFTVASVQNLYNLVNRQSEAVVEYCAQQHIAFIPWFPLAAGALARPGGVLDALAGEKRVSAAQLALAWVLARSPVMLPIPGTGRLAHLEENVRAAAVSLDASEWAALDAAGKAEWARTSAAQP